MDIGTGTSTLLLSQRCRLPRGLCTLLALAAVAPAQSPLPSSDPSITDAWRFELQLSPQSVYTKLHMRLGSADTAGTDVTASESGTLGYRPALALRFTATGPDPLFGGEFTTALAYRYLAFDGEADLEPHTWGGQTITHLDTEGTFNELDFELRHSLPITEQLTLQLGCAVENRIFHANYRTDVGSSTLDMNGSCLAPVVRAEYLLSPSWSLSAAIAGYAILQIDQDNDQLDDVRRIGASLRWHAGAFAAELGVSQQEADLVQDKNSTMETFVHSRLTAYSLTFCLLF